MHSEPISVDCFISDFTVKWIWNAWCPTSTGITKWTTVSETELLKEYWRDCWISPELEMIVQEVCDYWGQGRLLGLPTVTTLTRWTPCNHQMSNEESLLISSQNSLKISFLSQHSCFRWVRQTPGSTRVWRATSWGRVWAPPTWPSAPHPASGVSPYWWWPASAWCWPPTASVSPGWPGGS